jgi:hypothetical protein
MGHFHNQKIGKYCFGLRASLGNGTGETASPEQAQEMHEFIRETVRKALEVTLLKTYLSFTAEA